MLDGNIYYWAWFGTIYLIWLTVQDFRNKMTVDDRKNYFMLGITISLLTHITRGFFYLIACFVITFILIIILKKFKALGEADINSLSWIFLGFAFINPYKLAWFAMFFIVITAIYMALKLYLFKVRDYTPFYYVILISYVLNSLLFAIY